MNEYEMFEVLTQFRKPVLSKMIDALEIQPESKGIDIGCGIGRITNLLAKELALKIELIGLDHSPDLLRYAEATATESNLHFIQGDVNNINLADNAFDWIWSMDTLWVGPQESGCPIQEPNRVLQQLHRSLRPGGRIYLSFWSSQRFLIGHPLLEARLNAAVSANAPYTNDSALESHIFRYPAWLRKAGFIKIQAHSFVGEIAGPLNKGDKRALSYLFQMLWGKTKDEVTRADWQDFQKYGLPSSPDSVLHDQDYYGYYLYTLFSGQKYYHDGVIP